jgi:hypothetical protein
MITAMLLAHFIGDFVLQWEALAQWKSRAEIGAVTHGAIVTGVTLLFAWLIDPAWWLWALLIGLAHIIIDGAQPWLYRRFPQLARGPSALARLLVDQCLHLSVIAWALTASGQGAWASLAAEVWAAWRAAPIWAYALGYVFITMPAWIFVEFITAALVTRSAPDFSRALPRKYVGTLERCLVTTFVVLGQLALVPLVALPRLVLETPTTRPLFDRVRRLEIVEMALSTILAVAIGLMLKAL